MAFPTKVYVYGTRKKVGVYIPRFMLVRKVLVDVIRLNDILNEITKYNYTIHNTRHIKY